VLLLPLAGSSTSIVSDESFEQRGDLLLLAARERQLRIADASCRLD